MISKLKFIFLLIFEIPAVMMSILIFTYFMLNRAVRSKCKNHIWLVLICLNFSQLVLLLPMPMSYYYLNRIWPQTNAYCTWWSWLEYSTNTSSLILMGWASIERHLFIFYYTTFFRLRWKRWVFHFLPILFSLFWTPGFYFVMIVISPTCNMRWDFNRVLCGVPCFVILPRSTFGVFDFLFNVFLPLGVIIIANLALIIRVIYGRLSRQQIVRWRRNRKMTVQLWGVSSLYLAGWLPLTITRLIQVTLMPSFFLNAVEIILFMLYLIPIFLPFVCVTMVPDLTKRILESFQRHPRNQISMVVNDD